MRLYEYFKQNLERNPSVIDFHIRAERVQAGMIHFYIHPAYVDGVTLDFILTATGGMTPMGQVPGYEMEQSDGGEKVGESK